MTPPVELREVRDADLEEFFAHFQDPVAVHMAAFTAEDPSDREAFDAKWARIRSDPAITLRAILVGGRLVGHVSSFVMEGELELTYWLARSAWGQGVATSAVRQFLALMPDRPLHARAVFDNAGSLRVLEKCGFRRTGEDRGYAPARREQVREVLMRLDD